MKENDKVQSNYFDLSQICLYPFVDDITEPNVVVGIRTLLLNNLISAVHKGIYPMYVKDHMNFSRVMLSIQWNIDKAPVLKFKNTGEANVSVSNILEESLRDFQGKDEGSLKKDREKAIHFASGFLSGTSTLSAELSIPSIKLDLLRLDDKSKNCKLNLGALFSCYVSLSNDSVLTIKPFSGSINNTAGLREAVAELVPDMFSEGTDSDSLEEFLFLFINNVLMPYLVKSCENIVPQIKLPKLEYMGVHLHDVSIGVEDDILLVKTKIDRTGEPSEEEAVAWPKDNFFVMVDNHAVKIVTESLMEGIKKSLEGEIEGSNYHIAYNIKFLTPQVSLTDSQILLTMDLNAIVAVSIKLFGFQIAGIQAAVKTREPMKIYFKPELRGDKLYACISKETDVKLNIDVLSNNLISYFVSFIIKIVGDGITKAVLEILQKYFNPIELITLPSMNLNAFGMDIKLKVNKPSSKIEQSKLYAMGDLEISVTKTLKDRLGRGESLLPGEQLISADGCYALIYQKEGKVEIISTLDSSLIWSAKLRGMPERPAYLKMQEDGNLVAIGYKNGDQTECYWDSGTYAGDHIGHEAVIESDGEFVIYRADDIPCWSNRGAYRSDTLSIGRKLKPGDYILSSDGKYMFWYQPNGGIAVLTYPARTPVWRARVRFAPNNPVYLTMQEDGNLAAYDKVGNRTECYWSTDTCQPHKKGHHATLENDSYLKVYKSDGTICWSSAGYNCSEENDVQQPE